MFNENGEENKGTNGFFKIEDTDSDEVKAIKEQANITNGKLYARTKKAEGFTQDPDTGEWVKAPAPIITKKEDQAKPFDILDDEVANLRFEGYNREEIKIVMANGGPEILKDPNNLITAAIKLRREQARSEDAASKTGDSVGITDSSGKKYTEKELNEMPLEKLAQVLPHAS